MVRKPSFAMICRSFFRDEEKEIHDMFRLPGEFLSQLGVLRRNADGTGIEMALPHHDAAFDDQAARSQIQTPRRPASVAIATSRPVFI